VIPSVELAAAKGSAYTRDVSLLLPYLKPDSHQRAMSARSTKRFIAGRRLQGGGGGLVLLTCTRSAPHARSEGRCLAPVTLL
jgi:hypothetical protein